VTQVKNKNFKDNEKKDFKKI